MDTPDRATTTVQRLVPTIRETSQLMHTVIEVSTEQAEHVATVGEAIEAVERITGENASAAQELAATAEELAAQAEMLRSLANHFTLPGERFLVEEEGLVHAG